MHILELHQNQFSKLLIDKVFSNYLRQLISEYMIEFIESDLTDRRMNLKHQGINNEKVENAEWYEILAFDKMRVRESDNFISLLKDYLLGFVIEAAA